MKNKIKNLNELKKIRREYKNRNEKVVFTNGCFDLLHIGHVRYLYEAKKQGDILIVALNSDSSVKQLKGDNRPIINENERAELLAALEMTDYIVIFEELTAINLINNLKPDIYVKGGDYSKETLTEWTTVEKNGGEVKFLKEIKGRSTTSLINKINEINV
ncbi:MAG: D-glycero-beta-D-manno-heptose 1-phosphate adenylyltransferase [Bacillota bacterium]